MAYRYQEDDYPNELRRLLESLGPGESLDPRELANVLGGAGTTRMDSGDQPSREMMRAAPVALSGDMGDQPTRRGQSEGNALAAILQNAGNYGDQPQRAMARGPESAPAGPVDLASLPTDELAARYRPPRGGFVRREDTGETLFVNGQQDGIGTSPEDANRASLDAMRAQAMERFGANNQQRIKIAGYGNGIMSDVGETMGAVPPMDFARGPVDTPKGRGFYGKDGAVYVKGPEGYTKVLLGYDREASYVSNKRAMERRKDEVGIERDQAAIEHQREVTEGLRAARDVREDPFTQASLEKRYGKAEKGYQWTPEGKLVPMTGGSADTQSQTAVETGADTIRKIDEMIGKRDANGKLVEGAKPHPGFEDLIGATLKPGARFIPGTHAADMQARLDEVRGGAFLKAFETLKGGGQITEVEGKKATDAITRMDRSQSEDEFVKAALEFRNIVERGMQRAQSMRGGAPVAAPAASSVSAPQSAIDYLKANPGMRTAFDMKYGRGAAARVLGN